MRLEETSASAPRARKITIIGVALVLATVSLGLAPTSAHAVGPKQVSYILAPHPDDEFQSWSLVENSPDNYKVFITATRGEETSLCEPGNYNAALQASLGETAQSPSPAGRWTTSCVAARQESQIRFLTQMSSADASIPGSFGTKATVGPFAANGASLCRSDNGVNSCSAAQRTADVWIDSQGRGAVVSFDLGDGDLNAAEVAWTVATVRDNRGALGINSSLPNFNVVGAFSNTTTACVAYPHVDHRAVHQALWNTDFGFRWQAAATCAGDPDQSRAGTVSANAVQSAFAMSGSDQDSLSANRLGAHVKQYGWLAGDYYHVDRNGQSLLFHSHQNFWIRFLR